MRAFAKTFLDDERGATAVEYGLIIALITLVIVGAVTNAGTSLKGTFNKVNNDLTGS